MSEVHAFTAPSYLKLYLDDVAVFETRAPKDDPFSQAEAFFNGLLDALEEGVLEDGAQIVGTNGKPLSVKWVGRHLTAEQLKTLNDHFRLTWDEPLPGARRTLRRR